jgi:hypothetical protein
LKGKVNSTFLLVYKILRLLGHTNVKMDHVCQDKGGRLGGVAGSVVLYVSIYTVRCNACMGMKICDGTVKACL